jgi:hypothetical protein
MTWTQDYRLHSVRFHPDGGNELIISGITSANIAPNPEVLREVTSGNIYATTAVLQTLRFVGSFTTNNLSGVLGADGPGINAGMASCITSASEPGLDFIFARQGCAGPEASGHLIYNVASGVIVPTSLSVDHRGNAEISYDVYAQSTDGSSPVTKADLASLPTLSGNDLRWTMNAMRVNDVPVEGKRSINISFNANVLQEGADSDTFDSVVSIDSMLQKIVVTGVNPNWLDTTASPQADEVTGIFGESVTAGDGAASGGLITSEGSFHFYLKERNSTTGDAGDSTHIYFGANGLLNWENIISGDPRSPSQTALAVDVTNPNGATAPIVATPGVKIPTGA